LGEESPYFTLFANPRELPGSFATLRMTDEGLRMTDEGLRMTDGLLRMTDEGLRMTAKGSG
jgi:hypothetical protein